MKGRRNPFVAAEGLPLLLVSLLASWALATYVHLLAILPMIALIVLLILVFRDPRRSIPPEPLGVVSPVDGVIESIERSQTGVSQGEAIRIRIRVNSLGTYTARSPVEGMIKNLSTLTDESNVDYRTNAFWVQTDEGDDVVLQFDGYRLGLPPKALKRFGERIGQGQRCAYLRLARYAELHLPVDSQVEAKPGDSLLAGTSLLAKLPHP
ncbi:MAG: hypothetical protein QNJ05_00845 [Woeseiaceae bacterium]|nr:hypothetical protein [Woeseiaceae bacterium]